MNSEAACGDDGCGGAGVATCQYVDGQDERCVTRWCPEHLQSVHGADVCRRHAGVLRSVGAQPEAGLPGLDNRAPSLVNWVFRDIEFAVRALLARNGNVDEVAADDNVRLGENGAGGIVWQQSLASRGATAHEITVAVDEDGPTVVIVRVDHKDVLREEPPWITRRAAPSTAGGEPHAEDARFYSAIRLGIARLLGDRPASAGIGE